MSARLRSAPQGCGSHRRRRRHDMWCETIAGQRPEGIKSLGRHVGEPEAEEHRVVPAIRSPAEHVRLDEPRALVIDSCRRDRQHLRKRRQARSRLPRDAAARLSRTQGRTRSQAHHPPAGTRRAPRAAPHPREVKRVVVVLAGERPVVRDLLSQQPLQLVLSADRCHCS